MSEHKTIFHTLFKTNSKIIIDYFKGLLMTHHLDIFMSGKNLGLKRLTFISKLLESTAGSFGVSSTRDPGLKCLIL